MLLDSLVHKTGAVRENAWSQTNYSHGVTANLSWSTVSIKVKRVRILIIAESALTNDLIPRKSFNCFVGIGSFHFVCEGRGWH